MLNQLPEKCDAIIVGSGAAGLIAALSLKTGCPDAEVLLVEKTERLGGTTTYSGGICWLPGHRHKADPATDSRQARLYLRNIFPEIREDHLETFIATAPTVVDFMQDHGLEMEAIDGYPDYYSDIEGSSTGRSLSPAGYKGPKNIRSLIREVPAMFPPFTVKDLMGWGLHRFSHWDKPLLARRKLAGHETKGRAMIGFLIEACLNEGVQILLGKGANRLLVEQEKVRGVEFDGGTASSRVVIMACGGFSHQPNLMEKLGDIRQPLSLANEEGDTGGGLALALEAGLKVGNPHCWWMPVMKLYPEDQPKPGPVLWVLHPMIQDRSWPGGIMVNGAGKRFTNESACYMTVGEILARDKNPDLDKVWIIWGKYYVKHYIRGNTSFLQPAKPWMNKSSSLAQLADKTGLPLANLEETIDRWNRMAEQGRDEDFRRGELPYDRFMGDQFRHGHPNIEKLEPPFQAVRVHPGCLGTNMGPVIDDDGRTQLEDGSMVEGLYAAGNASASIFGDKYPGAGGTLGPAAVFGYRAGLHAAELLKSGQ
jgi:succinate dehydrogenase/fumarate reductase flavoprotein subunit